MCEMLLQKEFSYMFYLYMILSMLWIMDGRGVTTRPEEKD